jgi:integrase
MSLKLYRRGETWHYRGTVAGRRLRGSCKTTSKEIAARQASAIEAQQWKCHHDGPKAVLTFAQAALMYRAAGKAPRFLDRVEDYFKDTLVKDITPGVIIQMAMTLYGHTKGSSRNRMAIIPAQAIINHAADSELCEHIRIKRFKFDTKIKEPATLEWIKEFQKISSPHLGTYALFMYLTGARPGEATSVQWGDVDLKARTVLIRQTKVGDERVAHLPTMLVAALANLKPVRNRGVFIYKHPADAAKTWVALTERHGLRPLTPHCCRHGFATSLLRRGVDVVTVARLGGWNSSAQVLKTYGHANEDRTLTNLLVDADLTQESSSNSNDKLKSGTS